MTVYTSVSVICSTSDSASAAAFPLVFKNERGNNQGKREKSLKSTNSTKPLSFSHSPLHQVNDLYTRAKSMSRCCVSVVILQIARTVQIIHGIRQSLF